MATTINMAEQQNMRNIVPTQNALEGYLEPQGFQGQTDLLLTTVSDSMVSNAINESLIYHIENNLDAIQDQTYNTAIIPESKTVMKTLDSTLSSKSSLLKNFSKGSKNIDDSIFSDCINTAVCGCCDIVGLAAAAGLSEYYYPAAFGEFYYKEASQLQTQQRGGQRRGGELKPEPAESHHQAAREAESIIRGGCGGDRRLYLQQLRLRINQLEAEKESLVIQVSDLRQLMQRISDQGQQDLKAVMKLNRKLSSEVLSLKEDLQGVQKNSEHFNEMIDLWSNHVF